MVFDSAEGAQGPINERRRYARVAGSQAKDAFDGALYQAERKSPVKPVGGLFDLKTSMF